MHTIREICFLAAAFAGLSHTAWAQTISLDETRELTMTLGNAAIAESLGAEEYSRAEILRQSTKYPTVQRFIDWNRQYDAIMKGEPAGAIKPLPGAVTEFFVSFPFTVTSMFEFDRPFSPERGYDTTLAPLGALYPTMGWMKYESTGNNSVVLPQERVDNPGYAAMYLTTRIMYRGKKEVQAFLEIPSSTPVVAWMNGRKSLEFIEKGAVPVPLYGERWPVVLKPGENILTIKVAALETMPAFYVFLTDRRTGRPLDFSVELGERIESGPLVDAKPEVPLPSALSIALKDEADSLALRALVARTLLSENDAGRRIHDMLLTSVEKTASLEPDEIELAVLALNDPAKSLQILKSAVAKYPKDARLQLLYARQMILTSEEQGDSGVRFVDDWPEIYQKISSVKPPVIHGISYRPLQEKLLSLPELNSQQALTVTKKYLSDPSGCSTCENYLTPLVIGALTDRRLVSEYRHALNVLYAHQKNASAYLTDILSHQLREAVSANQPDVLAKVLVLIAETADSFFKIHPYDDQLWEFWLRVLSEYGVDSRRVASDDALKAALEKAGFTADADTWYMLYLSQRINDPKRWMLYAEHCLKLGQQAEVISAYEMASKLEPQNDHLALRAEMMRKLYNHSTEIGVREESSFETPYIIQDIPGNTDSQASGLVSLLDNRIVRILPSGLSSTYNQIAFEILDEQGLKAVRATPINYSPFEEKIEIISVTTTKKNGTVKRLYKTSEYNLADESVRMYYDQRQIVIEVPDLAVGDRIEFQFKRTQLRRDASSVLYYSDLYQLQTWFNRQWSRYTIIMPEEMDVRFLRHIPGAEPIFVGETRKENGKQITTYEEKTTPRFLPEDNMPGATEVMPFLLISTFKNWQELANWYIDLAAEQWKPDDAIRAKVKELIEGVTDPMEKLKRIHNFVVKSTRYVALEFGIHGHKPYPVSQIFDRRFGDCKDKASLLKVMLKEAGIESEFVLARTRQNGAITLALPAPYFFDHAILYVPEFDLFLDGTAEFSGTRELPAMDQDAQVMIIRDDASYTLRKIPVNPASDNLSKQTWVFDLSNMDSVMYSQEAEYSGFMAPSYRSRYQIETLQRERLESEIAYSIPGSKIVEYSFSDLMDLEKDVSMKLTAETSFKDVVKNDGNSWLVLPMVSASKMVQSFAPSAKRRTPLVQSVPLSFDKTVTLILPKNVTVELPEDVSETSPFGEYSVTVQKKGNELTTHVILTLTQTKISPSDYEAYLDFLQRFDRRLNTQYHLNRGD